MWAYSYYGATRSAPDSTIDSAILTGFLAAKVTTKQHSDERFQPTEIGVLQYNMSVQATHDDNLNTVQLVRQPRVEMRRTP